MSLNAAQKRAVDHGSGPLLINATAGSGKTRAITHRAASLLARGVDPKRLLLVTFTNKAAKEMKERIAHIVGAQQANAIWAGTFHSVCCKLLRSFEDDRSRDGRKKDFSIYDQDDCLGCIKGAMGELNIDPKKVKPSDIQEFISRAKSEGYTPEDLRDVDGSDELASDQKATWKRYESILKGNNAFDFDDLLNVVMRAAEGRDSVGQSLRQKWTHVLVDEYQDTSEVQFRIVKAFAASRNLSVVGDVNQSLYAWRGARPQNIIDFARVHYPDAVVVDMKTNYRSTQNIVECANAFVVNGDAETGNNRGEKVLIRGFRDEDEEARFVASAIEDKIRQGTRPSECVVLYRNHVLSRAIEDELRNRAVRYDIVGGITFYERKVVRDALAYLRLLVNQDSNLDFERVINNPSRGLGDKAVSKIRERARERGVSFARGVQAALAEGVVTGKPHENLTKFFYLYRTAAQMLEEKSASEVTDFLLTQSGYRKMLHDKLEKLQKEGRHADSQKAARDLEHVEAVVGAVAAYERRVSKPTLAGYLEEVSLITASDDASGEKVILSTVHGFKGLEADAVWVVGFEASILPPGDDAPTVEEEKRVAFVATSRARKSMTLSYANERMRYGKYQPTGPSMFLGMISDECSDWPERDAEKKEASRGVELTTPSNLSFLSGWLD